MKSVPVNCASNGHVWGALDRCVFCGAVKPPMPPAPPKLCLDCKWCRYPGVAHSTCAHDDAIKPGIDLVTGAELPSVIYCHTMRLRGPCGREARLFEAREAKP